MGLLNQQPVQQPIPYDATKVGILTNTIKGIPQAGLDVAKGIGASLLRFPFSLGEAVGRAVTGNKPVSLPPVQTPTGPIQSYQSEAVGRIGQGESVPSAIGKSALNIALDEPVGLGVKGILAVGGTLGKASLEKVIQDLAKSSKLDEVYTLLKNNFKSLSDDVIKEIAPRIIQESDPKIVSSIINEASSKVLQLGQKVGQALSPSEIELQQARQEVTRLGDEVSSLTNTTKKTNSNLNLNRINISEAGKGILSKTVNEIKPAIENTIGNRLSNKEVVQMADTTSKTLNRTIGRESTLAWESALLKARQKLAQSADSGTVDQEFIDNLMTVKTLGTDIARKLQSFSIGADPKNNTSKEAIIEAVMKINSNTDAILNAAKGVDFTNLSQATAFYRKFVKPTASEWLDLIRYNSMLSSPLTHIVNTASNLVNSAVVAPIEKAVTGGLDWLASPLLGKRSAYAGEAGAHLRGYLTNVKQAFLDFSAVMKGTQSIRNLDTRSIPIATTGAKGVLVTALSYPSRLLEASDRFFTALTQGAEEASLKYRSSKGVNVGNIETQAADKASYRLFRRELFPDEQGMLLDAIDQVTSELQGMRTSPNPLISNIAKFTVPFLRTPMNIFKQGIEYSPAGFGTIPGAKNKTEQLSKAIIGSSVFTGVSTYLMSNRISWAEPIDATQKAAYRAAGMQPYSVKIGNTWYSYQKLPPPIAFPFAMVAAIHDSLENKKITDDTADLVLTGISKYGQFLADQSYARNIGDLLTAVKGGESSITQLISNYPQQLIPYRAFTGWLARLEDPVQRKVDSSASFIDKQVQLLMMNIPGLSDNTPARLDPNGQPILQPNPVLNALSPVRTSQENPAGAQSYQNILDLKKRNQAETAKSAEIKSQAEQLDQQLQGMSPEEANTKVAEIKQSNPALFAKLKAIVTERKKGLTYEEKQMMNLGVASGERAKYVNEQILKLPTSEERNAYLKQLQDKKIVTAQVLEQLKKLPK